MFASGFQRADLCGLSRSPVESSRALGHDAMCRWRRKTMFISGAQSRYRPYVAKRAARQRPTLPLIAKTAESHQSCRGTVFRRRGTRGSRRPGCRSSGIIRDRMRSSAVATTVGSSEGIDICANNASAINDLEIHHRGANEAFRPDERHPGAWHRVSQACAFPYEGRENPHPDAVPADPAGEEVAAADDLCYAACDAGCALGIAECADGIASEATLWPRWWPPRPQNTAGRRRGDGAVLAEVYADGPVIVNKPATEYTGKTFGCARTFMSNPSVTDLIGLRLRPRCDARRVDLGGRRQPPRYPAWRQAGRRGVAIGVARRRLGVAQSGHG